MQPNLLFLYTDEQAFKTLAAYGNMRIRMPNLDRLAAESVVFDEAYVTQPVCTPSRSSLLTGLYPHANGCTANNAVLRPETPCLPEMLPRGDFVTAHFGKWHLGDELFAQHGFDEWVSVEDGYNKHFTPGRDREVRSDYHRFLVASGFAPRNGVQFGRGEAARLPEEWGKPAFLAREACRFIRANRRRPFALYVNFLEPHMPFFGPRDNQYPPDGVDLPPNFDRVPAPDQPLKARLLAEHYRRNGNSGLALGTEADWRRMIANYWGLCSLVDTHAGAILDAIDACGLRENTLVVFTSDHGDMMGAHRLLAKCVMFQEAVRVPLLVRLPGQRAGRRVRGPVSHIDLVPTLLDLMGRPAPERLQGVSLRPAIDTGASGRDVFIEWNGPDNGLGDVSGDARIPGWMTALAPPEKIRAASADPMRSIVTAEGWKFNFSPLGEHELYDLGDDPGETRNLFAQAAQRVRVRDLARRIRRWQRETADAVELPVP